MNGVSENNMNKKEMEYVKNENNHTRLIRAEILFSPLLLALPFIVGLLLIRDWYIRGLLEENSIAFFGELIIGLLIILGNILFDIPFIRSLKKLSNKN